MIKLVFVLRRLPELSREEFQAYWYEKHGPLVRERASALGISRYVQQHTIDTPMNEGLRTGRGGPEPYDGVAELWWESLEALQAAVATPEGQKAVATLLEDERRFIDLPRSPLWLCQERPIVEVQLASQEARRER
jgi:uncharacterized protein (TIGR02118 family)